MESTEPFGGKFNLDAYIVWQDKQGDALLGQG